MSRTGDSKKSSNVTPDKGHMNKSVTSYPLQKYPIHKIERTEPHGSKSNYKGSDNSYTERSHDEKNIENYENTDDLSNKDKEDAEYS